MYTHTWTTIRSRNMYVMSLCHDEGPLQSPCCRLLLTNVPNGDEKSILGTSSGSTRICSYASDMLITDTYLWEATASLMRSWLGSGVESIMVLALCSCASTTVQSLNSAPALGIDRSGMAFLTVWNEAYIMLVSCIDYALDMTCIQSVSQCFIVCGILLG